MISGAYAWAATPPIPLAGAAADAHGHRDTQRKTDQDRGSSALMPAAGKTPAAPALDVRGRRAFVFPIELLVVCEVPAWLYLLGVVQGGTALSLLGNIDPGGISIQRGFFGHGFFRHVTPRRSWSREDPSRENYAGSLFPVRTVGMP